MQTIHALADRGLIEIRVSDARIEVAVTEHGASVRQRLESLLRIQ